MSSPKTMDKATEFEVTKPSTPKQTTQLVPVVIGSEHLDQVADILYKRLQSDEKETLLKLFIKKETAKKIEESSKKGKKIEI